MKRFFVARLTVVLGAVAIGVVVSPSEAPAQSTPGYVTHAGIHVHRNDDGTVKHGPRNEVATQNWSGFAVAHFETGQTYTAAQASWRVPAVTFDTLDTSGSQAQYSSTWVGIGGFCENVLCTRGDRSLIQLGTEQDVTSTGATSYYSWYEMLPQYPVVLPTSTYPVLPGDTISASLLCNAPCPSLRRQSWTLTMSNLTEGWRWSVTVPYASSKLSAEWIEEAPYAGGVLPLADFGTATIDPTIGTGELTPALTVAKNGIQMLDPWGQTANPSTPGASFNVCWGSGGKFAAC